MKEKLKELAFNNWGLKLSALLLAVLVWGIISGRERTFSERTLKIPVEVANVSENVEVVSLRPEEVSIALRGASKFVAAYRAESQPIRIDLSNIKERSKLNYFAEDYLEIPKEVQLVSIHPKMIEVYVEEFATREVPVKIRFRGRLPASWRMTSAKTVPDRVTIMGYKSQIADIDAVWTEEVNLAGISGSLSRPVALKQVQEILKFRDRQEVELVLEIEDRSAKK
ncbi:MAG: YbbR-like domain-containing protein [Candidatus Aminicenantes bacterium]|nr:YbbR-like domain-containing protein [Candidatus Aminicenantes bacterium]